MTSAVLFVGALAIIIAVGVLLRERREVRRLSDDLEWYRKTYLTRQGYLASRGNYCLMSFDGGRNWYDMSRDGDNVTVIGSADSSFMRELDGMHALLEHVRKHGPIDLNQPRQVSLLQNAGITVERKPS